MDVQEVMQQLEAAGSEQTRKTYRRHGVTNEMFGVSYAALYALQKKIKINQDLAKKLWATGNHDAQVLATLIADPRQFTAKEFESWAKDLNNNVISDAFAKLAAASPLAQKLSEKWRDAKSECLGQTGWLMLAVTAANKALPDSYFEPFLETIERDIHSRKNRVRHSMNNALIAIGLRDKLQKRALAVAKKIGKVEVDHGDTNCKTPDAGQYILKAAEHRKRKAAGI
ncbi:MAG: DNA alkylation repair protein [Acidobacteriota bacterium]